MPANGERTCFYRLIVAILRAFFGSFWRVEVEGWEHVPADGRAIVAFNHRSMADMIIVVALAGRRFTHYIMKEELFRIPAAGPFFRAMGGIAIDRFRIDRAALKSAIDVLEKEGLVVIAPEGTRSKTGIPGKPKPGISLLAHQAKAPVVPARIWNTERFPRPGVMKIRFGPPMRFEGEGERDSYRAFAERVMESIFKL